MRRVKAAKGSRRPQAHEPGKGPKEQNATFPLEGTHPTNQPAKARTVSTDSNGNAAHQIARHVTGRIRQDMSRKEASGGEICQGRFLAEQVPGFEGLLNYFFLGA